MTATFIPVAATAKLVRKALKRAFPDQKFSVRSSSYVNGASINVRWTDGPRRCEVQAAVGRFAGATFDGMQDLKEYHASELTYEDDPERDGEVVHFGADYVFTNREYSAETLAGAAAAVVRERGGEIAYEVTDGPYPGIRSEYRDPYNSRGLSELVYLHLERGEE